MSTATSPPSSPQVLVGRTVRMMREVHQLGLRELAALVGISPSHLSRVETGERVMSAALETRICDVIATLPAAEKSA